MSIDSAKVRPMRVASRQTVPWATVLPLAIVLAYADGFWMTSLRGATGAIERNQEPFASWWRESTLSIPVFVFAVIGALTLALRFFGPTLRRPRTVLSTALLVVAAGTVAGIAEVVASASYDYHLEAAQATLMDAMHTMCQVSCLPQQLKATFDLQVTSVLYASGFILVTNLVLVGWMLALGGGRLKVAGRPSRDGASGDRRGRVGDVRVLLVAGLIACAHLHAAAALQHLTHWAAAAGFFVLLAATEVALARMLLGRVRRTVLLLTAGLSAGLVALLLYARIAGLPFGPGAGSPAAVGIPDAAAAILEVGMLIAAVVLLRGKGRLARRPRLSAHIQWLALVAVIAITAIGLAGTAPNWFDRGTSGAPSVMIMSH